MAKIIQLKNHKEKIYPKTYEKILYSSDGSDGNITLNDNPQDYKYIDIFFIANDYYLSHQRIIPNKTSEKAIILSATFVNNASIYVNYTYMIMANYILSNNVLVRGTYRPVIIENNNVVHWGPNWGGLKIYQVVGYK